MVASPPRRRGPHRQGDDATVYTDRWKWPFDAVSGYLCTLLHRESRYELRRELRQDQVRWHALCRPMRLSLCLIIASCAHLKQIIIYLMPSLTNYGHSSGVKTYDPQFEKRCPSCIQPEGQHCIASVKQGDKRVRRVLKSRSCCVCSLSRWGNSGGWCSHRPEIRAFSR